jgi:hypothetical protein
MIEAQGDAREGKSTIDRFLARASPLYDMYCFDPGKFLDRSSDISRSHHYDGGVNQVALREILNCPAQNRESGDRKKYLRVACAESLATPCRTDQSDRPLRLLTHGLHLESRHKS